MWKRKGRTSRNVKVAIKSLATKKHKKAQKAEGCADAVPLILFVPFRAFRGH
jgi:hypothetical protein